MRKKTPFHVSIFLGRDTSTHTAPFLALAERTFFLTAVGSAFIVDPEGVAAAIGKLKRWRGLRGTSARRASWMLGLHVVLLGNSSPFSCSVPFAETVVDQLRDGRYCVCLVGSVGFNVNGRIHAGRK